MSGLGDQKKKAIMRRYNRVLESHGKMAKYISKAVIYGEVALPFFISPVRVGIIVLEQLKAGCDGSEDFVAYQEDLDRDLDKLAEEETKVRENQ